jgi:hypothetical protein
MSAVQYGGAERYNVRHPQNNSALSVSAPANYYMCHEFWKSCNENVQMSCELHSHSHCFVADFLVGWENGTC